MNEFTHYLKVDYRAKSLELIIDGLKDGLETLEKQVEEIEWYDGIWFQEESEPIYGLAFIAFQNYINSSIKDFKGNFSQKQESYKLKQRTSKFTKSKIELIVALANYSKHKEEGIPHKGTREVLDSFNIAYEDIANLNNSPIFVGLTILNKKWNLLEIKNIVTEWRKLLYNQSVKLN